MSIFKFDKFGNFCLVHNNETESVLYRFLSQPSPIPCPFIINGQFQGVATQGALIPAASGHTESGQWEFYIPRGYINNLVISPILLNGAKLDNLSSYFIKAEYKLGQIVSTVVKIPDNTLPLELLSYDVKSTCIYLTFNQDVYLPSEDTLQLDNLSGIGGQGTSTLILRLSSPIIYTPDSYLHIPTNSIFALNGHSLLPLSIPIVAPYQAPHSIHNWYSFESWRQDLQQWRPDGNIFNGDQHISFWSDHLNNEIFTLVWIGQVDLPSTLLQAKYNPEYTIPPAWELVVRDRTLTFSYQEKELDISFQKYLNQPVRLIIRHSSTTQEVWINGELVVGESADFLPQNPALLSIDNFVGEIHEIHLSSDWISNEEIAAIENYYSLKYS